MDGWDSMAVADREYKKFKMYNNTVMIIVIATKHNISIKGSELVYR